MPKRYNINHITIPVKNNKLFMGLSDKREPKVRAVMDKLPRSKNFSPIMVDVS